MSETGKALDAMGARLVSQIWTTATSSKFWITVLGMYLAFQQGGVEGLAAALGLGGVYVGAKTYQNTKFKDVGISPKVEVVSQGGMIPQDVVPNQPAATGNVWPAEEASEEDELYQVDWEDFDVRVLNKAKRLKAVPTLLNGEPSPIAIYQAIKNVGNLTQVWRPDDLVLFGARLHEAASAQFEHIVGFTFNEADKHLGDDNTSCPHSSVQIMCLRHEGDGWYTAYRDLAWAWTKLQDTQALVARDIESHWRDVVARRTLMWVVGIAYQMDPAWRAEHGQLVVTHKS